jgi:hypothetical protein
MAVTPSLQHPQTFEVYEASERLQAGAGTGKGWKVSDISELRDLQDCFVWERGDGG